MWLVSWVTNKRITTVSIHYKGVKCPEIAEMMRLDLEQAIIEAEHRVPMVVLHEKQMKYEDSYVVVRLKDFKEITNEQQERVSDGAGKG